MFLCSRERCASSAEIPIHPEGTLPVSAVAGPAHCCFGAVSRRRIGRRSGGAAHPFSLAAPICAVRLGGADAGRAMSAAPSSAAGEEPTVREGSDCDPAGAFHARSFTFRVLFLRVRAVMTASCATRSDDTALAGVNGRRCLDLSGTTDCVSRLRACSRRSR